MAKCGFVNANNVVVSRMKITQNDQQTNIALEPTASNIQLKLNTSNTSFSALFVLGPEQDEMTRLDICQKVMVAADYLPIQAQFKE